MKAIYTPNGAAREYAPLAANLWRGCGHGCTYCYAPSCVRMSRADFLKAAPRKGILKQLALDAKRIAATGERGPVLLCFTSDPYQPLEAIYKIARQAITILGDAGLAVRILTKNGKLALRDLDLFKSYDVEVGMTMLFTHEGWRRRWEPFAGTLRDRREALATAHAAGVRTWLSIEPVIDTSQALNVILENAAHVDTFKVGKLNHHKDLEASIDWPRFLEQALVTLTRVRERWGVEYYIKDDLWKFATAAIRERRYKKATAGALTTESTETTENGKTQGKRQRGACTR